MTHSSVQALDPGAAIAAASFAKGLALSGAARGVLSDATSVRDFVDRLLAAALAADALVVVARALPKRYAIAWACDCFKTALAGERAVTDIDRAGLALAQQWLTDPTEENRRAALEFAERDEFASPGAWLAASAGWGGGSLAPRGYDPIEPPEHLPAEAAVAALRLLAARSADYEAMLTGFVRRALEIFGPAGRSADATKRTGDGP